MTPLYSPHLPEESRDTKFMFFTFIQFTIVQSHFHNRLDVLGNLLDTAPSLAAAQNETT